MTDMSEYDVDDLQDSIYATDKVADPSYKEASGSTRSKKTKGWGFKSIRSLMSKRSEDDAPAYFVGKATDELVAQIGPRPDKLPIIGNLSATKQYLVCGTVVVSCLVCAAGVGFFGARQTGFAGQRTAVASAVQTLSQSIAVSSQAALLGDGAAVASMSEAVSALGVQMRYLLDGDPTTGMQGLKTARIPEVMQLDVSGKLLVEKANAILALTAALKDVDEVNTKAKTSASEVFQLAVQLESVLASTGASKAQLAAAEHIKIASERVRRNAVVILESRNPESAAVGEIVADVQSIYSAIDALSEGGGEAGVTAVADRDAKSLLTDLAESSKPLSNVSVFMAKYGVQVVDKRRDQVELLKAASSALKDAGTVASVMATKSTVYKALQFVSGIFMVIAILGVLLIGLVTTRLTKIEGWESRRKNKMNEDQIIDFSTAIEPLELGDLRLDFVSDLDALEGITGPLRSSLHGAVAALRNAVQTVKKTAGGVSEIVGASVLNTKELEQVNERQSAEIDEVLAKAEILANAFTVVIEKTIRAAEMTNESKLSSAQAAKVVAKTNESLQDSELLMQELMKSVKFLGETSHEIGQTVGQIEEITDKTSVIATNTELEAAKAGAFGAGFRVLAGEVSRLAEQSNRLLISITNLVQRNREETAGAILLVEKATGSVKAGAALANNANIELTKISISSENVAQFVDEIRQESDQQSATTVEVRQAMNRLNSLSQESRSAVTAVVANVSQIDESMGKLQKTVSTFVTE